VLRPTVATLGQSPGCDNGIVSESVVCRECVAYCGDQLLDIYEPEHSRTSTAVLLWHGSGANERDVLEPLAHQIASAGVLVMVPDWSTDDDANGRKHLTASLTFVRSFHSKVGAVDRVLLAGWSLGASAGLDVVRHPELLGGWRPAGFVGISGGFNRSPFFEEEWRDSSVDPSIPLVLVHGSSDEVALPERARVTRDHLLDEGWSVRGREVTTDHAGAIGTVYDPARHRCVPTDDPSRLEVLTTVASLIADLALAG
jgi:predicted esterase